MLETLKLSPVIENKMLNYSTVTIQIISFVYIIKMCTLGYIYMQFKPKYTNTWLGVGSRKYEAGVQ